jgi:hypothetical protein
MESLTLHDKSMLTLILHCNRTKAPKGFFSFMALLKKEIKAQVQHSKSGYQRHLHCPHEKGVPLLSSNFVDIPLAFPAIIPNSLKKKMNATMSGNEVCIP